MTIRRAATLTLIALSIGSFTYATYAVTYAQRSASEAPALTAADYVEIQQLVARYGFALDTGADNGYMLADMFAPGGSFNQIQGREALAGLARGGRRGPLNVRNMSNFAIIKPSREGATGIQYAQAINFGERDKKTPTEMDHFAHYEDEFVKTADGWRFKSRRTFNEGGSLRPASQRTPPATDSSPTR
jgi:hypothetical protein